METAKRGGEGEGLGEGGAVFLLDPSSPSCPGHLAGGKGHNLWELGRMERCQVPPWFCVTTDAFSAFVEVSERLMQYIIVTSRLMYMGLLLHTELMVSLFIRCTMRCEIWAQPAELPR